MKTFITMDTVYEFDTERRMGRVAGGEWRSYHDYRVKNGRLEVVWVRLSRPTLKFSFGGGA